jgi:hypothetical protein
MTLVTFHPFNFSQKSNKNLMAETIARETKREGQKKAKKHTTHKSQKKGRESWSLSW